MNEQLQRLMSDPQKVAKDAGFTVPEGIRDPQQIVQHLIMTGQVPNGVLQRIMPMIQRMNGK